MKPFDIITKDETILIVLKVEEDNIICYDTDLKYVNISPFEIGWETIHECTNIVEAEIYLTEHLL